jgi:transcriptional regulator of acetoin/glycerol metabolism
LIDALVRNKGRLDAVAHELDVSVRTVQRRMKESGLRLRDFRSI